jgi:hypothetical protein
MYEIHPYFETWGKDAAKFIIDRNYTSSFLENLRSYPLSFCKFLCQRDVPPNFKNRPPTFYVGSVFPSMKKLARAQDIILESSSCVIV